MSESCTLNIVNNSGRSLDSIMMWHTPTSPDPSDIIPQNAAINAQNVPAGKTLTAQVPLVHSPLDYWTSGVLFEGDGTTYLMCGVLGDPYKEYEVSDGSTITFTLAEYTSGTTNQSDIAIAYSGDDGGFAFLLNPTTVVLIALGDAIIHALGEMAEA